MPERIRAAASRARKTAQASREKRGAEAALDCGGALDIDDLLWGKIQKAKLRADRSKDRPLQKKEGRKPKSEERRVCDVGA